MKPQFPSNRKLTRNPFSKINKDVSKGTIDSKLNSEMSESMMSPAMLSNTINEPVKRD